MLKLEQCLDEIESWKNSEVKLYSTAKWDFFRINTIWDDGKFKRIDMYFQRDYKKLLKKWLSEKDALKQAKISAISEIYKTYTLNILNKKQSQELDLNSKDKIMDYLIVDGLIRWLTFEVDQRLKWPNYNLRVRTFNNNTANISTSHKFELDLVNLDRKVEETLKVSINELCKWYWFDESLNINDLLFERTIKNYITKYTFLTQFNKKVA